MAETRIRLKHAIKKTFAFPTGQAHKLVLIRPKLFVLDVEDAHFNFDRHVLLPDLADGDGSTPVLDTRRVTGLGVIYAALAHAQGHAAQGVMVTGHSDAKGAAGLNQKLSEDRARSVSFVLRGKRDDWRKLAAATDATDDVQTVLKWQSQRAGWDCDPGPINNKLNSQTTRAIGRFQELYNVEVDRAKEAGADSPFKKKIGVDKTMGADSWGAVYDLYMSELMDLMELQGFSALEQLQAKLKAPPSMTDFVGCGEHIPFNPARRNPFEKGSDEHLEGPQKNPVDRRVEILFFDPGEEVDLVCHPKPGQCKPAECPVYVQVPHQQAPIGIPKGLGVAEVNLRLTFVDPEGKVRPLPEGLEVEAKFGEPPDALAPLAPDEPANEAPILDDLDDDGLMNPFEDEAPDAEKPPVKDAAPTPAPPPPPPTTPGADPDAESMEVDQEPNEKIGPNGVVRFTIPRKASSMFLRVLAGEDRCIVTADPKQLDQQKLVTLPEALDEVAAGRVFFQLPPEFHSRQGYFALPGTPPAGVTFKDGAFLNVDNRQTQLGTREAPVELQLAIHWQHFKFTYFDRWTSSATCVPQPRSKDAAGKAAPPLILEGIAKLIDAQVNPRTSEASSAWEIKVGTDTVHCLGWVRREIVVDQPRRELPDDKCTTRFRANRLFVRTDGDGAAPDAPRAFVSFDVADKTPSTPGVDRLRLYDVPPEWRTRCYPARVEGESADKTRPFEQLLAKPSTLAKPYVVSLDTIVLQGSDGGPHIDIKWDDSKVENRITLFDSKLAVYKPDPPASEPYFTRVAELKPAPVGPVLTDFAPFTRLITRGNALLDVFDRRTRPSELFKDLPVGARFAVRLPVGDGLNLTATLSARPFQAPRDQATAIGGTAGVFLRCCGHDKNVELFHVINYGAVSFDFPATITAAEKAKYALLATAQPMAAPPANATDLMRACLVDIMNRWNGADGVNKDPALYEVGDPIVARGQYHVRLHRIAASTAGSPGIGEVRVHLLQQARAFMDTDTSYWQLNNLKADDEDVFVAAHEFGHAFSLPDEYTNKDFQPSLRQPNIGEQSRSRGAPWGFDADGMMTGNKRVRARYFWDLMLYARSQGHFADAKKINIKHGTFNFSTELGAPGASRVRFPVFAKLNVAPRGVGLCDLFVYLSGKDEFLARDIDGSAAARPYDGMVVVRVKMAWDITVTESYGSLFGFLKQANGTIFKAFNTSKAAAVRAKLGRREVRLRLYFAPRFISSRFPKGDGASSYLKSLLPALPQPFTAHDHTDRVNALIGTHGVHVNVRLGDGDPGVHGAGQPRQASVRNDGSFLVVFSDDHFDDDTIKVFGQMVGVVGGGKPKTKADYQPLVDALAPELKDAEVEFLG